MPDMIALAALYTSPIRPKCMIGYVEACRAIGADEFHDIAKPGIMLDRKRRPSSKPPLTKENVHHTGKMLSTLHDNESKASDGERTNQP